MRSATKAGISTERFWQLTPAEVGIEIEAWESQQEMLDFRAGLICAVLANVNRDPKTKAFTPQDFMVDRKAEPHPEKPQQSWQEMQAIMKELKGALDGSRKVG